MMRKLCSAIYRWWNTPYESYSVDTELYDSYFRDRVRHKREAISAQEVIVERAQAQLDKLRAELKLLELEEEGWNCEPF